MPTGWAIVIVVQWVAIVALVIVVLGILRQLAAHLDRAPATESVLRIQSSAAAVGTRLPAFASAGDGGVTEPATLPGGQPAVLLFLSAGCAPCQSLAAEISGSDLPGELSGSLIAVTAPGSESSIRLPAGVRVLAVPDAECTRVLGVPGRPFAMAVNADGVITAKQLVNTRAQLTSMAASAWTLDEVPQTG
jgi:hypothetical protein